MTRLSSQLINKHSRYSFWLSALEISVIFASDLWAAPCFHKHQQNDLASWLAKASWWMHIKNILYRVSLQCLSFLGQYRSSTCWQQLLTDIHVYIHTYACIYLMMYIVVWCTYWCMYIVCICDVYCTYLQFCTYTRILTYFWNGKLLGASILSYTYNIRVYVQYTYNILNHIRADTSKYMQYTCIFFGSPFQITIFHLACIWTYMQYIHV